MTNHLTEMAFGPSVNEIIELHCELEVDILGPGRRTLGVLALAAGDQINTLRSQRRAEKKT